jgi:hypothetical protein
MIKHCPVLDTPYNSPASPHGTHQVGPHNSPVLPHRAHPHAHNLAILLTFEFNFIAAQQSSIITHQCKCWPTSLLQPLCGHHPLWPCTAKWLSLRVTFISTVLLETDQFTDLKAVLAWRNHQVLNSVHPPLTR